MKKILTLLLCTVMLCACSDDDDNNSPGNSNFNGSWNMDSYTAFMDVLPVLEDGDITWTFTNDGTRLTVNNTVEQEYPYILASGTYNATVYDSLITIAVGDGLQKYTYNFADGGMLLTDINATGDGPIIQFSRN